MSPVAKKRSRTTPIRTESVTLRERYSQTSSLTNSFQRVLLHFFQTEHKKIADVYPKVTNCSFNNTTWTKVCGQLNIFVTFTCCSKSLHSSGLSFSTRYWTCLSHQRRLLCFVRQFQWFQTRKSIKWIQVLIQWLSAVTNEAGQTWGVDDRHAENTRNCHKQLKEMKKASRQKAKQLTKQMHEKQNKYKEHSKMRQKDGQMTDWLTDRHTAGEGQVRGSSALLPDIRVKPPGSTTPADVFSTVPLVEEVGCQEGALVCTCMDTEDEDEEEDEEKEEEEGVDCVVPGRLDMVNAGLITSYMERQRQEGQGWD